MRQLATSTRSGLNSAPATSVIAQRLCRVCASVCCRYIVILDLCVDPGAEAWLCIECVAASLIAFIEVLLIIIIESSECISSLKIEVSLIGVQIQLTQNLPWSRCYSEIVTSVS